MNVWKITAANTLINVKEKPVPAEGKRKIRVTKVFVNENDARIYSGAVRVKYPRIMGRFAVGVVADDKGGLFPKGARVLLHTYLPEEDSGTQKRDIWNCPVRVSGETADGYLRDFVFQDENDMTALPDSVNDEKALLAQHVALAKAAIDALDPHRGDHVAVIGGDMLGLLVCQLLIYQQVSPMLIDPRADRTDFARSHGVYYTAVADENITANVAELTGGRLADGVIFTTGSGADGTLAFSVCAREKNVVFCGRNEDGASLSLNEILGRQLTVHGISDGTDYIETAINLIANRAIDLSPFQMKLTGAEKLPALFKNYTERPDRPVNEMNVVNLL